MDDFKLMMAKMHGDELRREAEQSRRAADARCGARTRPTADAAPGPMIRPVAWLATMAGRMRPTAAGR
jgi:hypothetical protein